VSVVWCDTYFDVLNRLRADHKCDGRTERWIDSQTERPLAVVRLT